MQTITFRGDQAHAIHQALEKHSQELVELTNETKNPDGKWESSGKGDHLVDLDCINNLHNIRKWIPWATKRIKELRDARKSEKVKVFTETLDWAKNENKKATFFIGL